MKADKPPTGQKVKRSGLARQLSRNDGGDASVNGNKEKKVPHDKKKRFSITRGQGTSFDVIPEDEPLPATDKEFDDYYEVAPERLEIEDLPPEEVSQRKDRSLSLSSLANSLSFFRRFSK